MKEYFYEVSIYFSSVRITEIVFLLTVLGKGLALGQNVPETSPLKTEMWIYYRMLITVLLIEIYSKSKEFFVWHSSTGIVCLQFQTSSSAARKQRTWQFPMARLSSFRASFTTLDRLTTVQQECLQHRLMAHTCLRQDCAHTIESL